MSTKIGIPIRPVPIFNITQSKIEFDLFLEIQKKLPLLVALQPLLVALQRQERQEGIGKVYNNLCFWL
jgi:hypothetical protein